MPADDLQQQLLKYLEDIHSTEQNAITQLRDGADSADDQELASAFREHLAETEELALGAEEAAVAADAARDRAAPDAEDARLAGTDAQELPAGSADEELAAGV